MFNNYDDYKQLYALDFILILNGNIKNMIVFRYELIKSVEFNKNLDGIVKMIDSNYIKNVKNIINLNLL